MPTRHYPSLLQHGGFGRRTPAVAPWSWAAADNLFEMTPEWSDHLGWPPAESRFLPDLARRSLLTPDGLREVEAAWASLSAGRSQMADLRLSIQSHRGAACWVRLVAFVSGRNHDSSLAGLHGTLEDIGAQVDEAADARGQLEAISKAQIVSEFDLEGRLLSANDNFLQTFGYSLAELVGQHHSRLVHTDLATSAGYREFWDRLGRGEYAAGQYQRVARDGREIWIQATYNPILDASGRPYKVVKYACDISDQQRRSLDTEGQLAAINRAQMTMEFAIDGVIRTANSAALTVLEYRIDELWGRHHSVLVDPAERESTAYKNLWDALARGEFASGLYRRLTKSGREIWIQAVYSPILDLAGRPWKVVKYASDVTARVATEIALKNGELKFRALFDLSPVGMALLNAETGRFLEVNDGLVSVLGFSRDELLAMTFNSVTGTEPDAALPVKIPMATPGSRFEPQEHAFTRRDGTNVRALIAGIAITDAAGVRQIWTIIQTIETQKTVQEHLAAAALTDALTGLPNRAAFVQALTRLTARHRIDDPAFAVLFIDFDRFKLVNDTLGHAAGDQLLCHIAMRLAASIRHSERDASGGVSGMAARFGGDEFAVLVTDLRKPGAIEVVSTRLLATLAQPYEIQGRTIHSSASIGIVLSTQGSMDAGEIIQRADVAMYEAKHCGRARAVVFDQPMQSRLTRRLLLESDLRDALRADRLKVVYQPIVDLDSGLMVSAEALVRWTHPTLGAISPSEFVPIAEESGLIVPLGQFVLRESCRQFMEWQRLDAARAPKSISVNLSRSELALGDVYVRQLGEAMSASGIAPGSLQLEITEREIVRDPALSLALMMALKATGVRLAMDDFGTGASSLSCLRNFPFDTIKIDQSFLNNLESEKDVLMVLHATVTLIDNLGMHSVAEGIERPAQVTVLQSMRCRAGQGYLFSRPVCGDLLTQVDCLGFRREK